MARLNVNPTRMELRKLKTRLKTAVRGHKLLKDNSDEPIRQFMIYIRENQKLRKEIEGELGDALKYFMLASAVTTSQVMEEAVAMPGYSVKLETRYKVPSTSDNARFILPASSENTRIFTILFARRSTSEAVSVGAIPKRTKRPTVPSPHGTPSAEIAARSTLCITALILHPAPWSHFLRRRCS